MHQYLKNQKGHVQQRFMVLAIAPATIIPDEICYRSYNYVSKKDFIPFIRPSLLSIASAAQLMGQTNHERPLIRDIPSGNLGELRFLKPHRNTKLLDHNFDSPTFSSVKEEHLSEYFKIRGENQ